MWSKTQPLCGWLGSPPGASMTPSRVTNSDTISFLMPVETTAGPKTHRSVDGCAVDQVPQDVGVAGVPGGFLDHVRQDHPQQTCWSSPAQVCVTSSAPVA